MKKIYNSVVYIIITMIFVYVCITFFLLFVQDVNARSNRLTSHLEHKIGTHTEVYIIHDKETDTDYIYTIDEREIYGAYGGSISTTSSIVQIDSKDKGE